MSKKYSGNISGSEAQLTPEYESSGRSQSKSKLFYVVIVLAVVFFATTIVFIGLFAHQVVKNKDETEPLQSGTVPTTPGPKEDTECKTPECVIAAAAMLKKMNLNADPCKDFNEYACGRFLKETVIPDGATDVVSFNILNDANNLVMKDIVTGKNNTDPTYLSEMKAFYNSCIDEDTIEKVGLGAYKNDPLYTDWPIINRTWTNDDNTLADVIARYLTVDVAPLFDFFVESDEYNSSRRVIYLDQPSLGLAPEYFNDKPLNDTTIKAYHTYLYSIAVAIGANETGLDEYVTDVVKLEQALSSIMVLQEDMRNSTQLYNPVPLANLNDRYQNLNMSNALRAVFSTANVALSDNDIVIDRFPSYFGKILTVFQPNNNSSESSEKKSANLAATLTPMTETRNIRLALQNLFGFKYAIARVGALTKELREIKLRFDKVLRGLTSEPARWKVCVQAVASAFPDGMGKQYVERNFPNSSKIYMKEMIKNLKTVFRGMIEETTWMNETTKAEAVNKLEVMGEKIGYPDSHFETNDLNEKYKNYKMSPGDYYHNRVLKDELVNKGKLASLTEPVDKSEFGMASYIVNAQYSPNWNDITFPAGILQDPFYSQNFLDSVNYGGIGVVIGHEITHGFDDQGSQYDANGTLRDWWQPSDKENFINKSQCIVDQFNNFTVPEIGEHVNGKNTQGESSADTGGVKESFRAYMKLVSEKGKQQTLPGIPLTANQLFFLSFGQIWCDKITDAALKSQMLLNVHPPGKFRIIGSLQNSEYFADAYNCPSGSYMNPKKKCGVW